MSAPKTMYAQEILSVQPHYDTPCEGTYVNIYVELNPDTVVADSIIWTKNGSKSALPIGWNANSITGNVDCYEFSVADNGDYEVTCYKSNGSSEMVNVQLSVNPNPNAGYALITKCNSVEIVPSGGDYYLTYDENGGLSVPFYGDTLTGTGLLLPGGGFRAFTVNGCYSDVTIGQIWANPLMVNATPTKWQIKPGQTSTITASANWPTVASKTKWYKVTTGAGQTSISTLIAQGCSTLTVSDTGVYRVSMKATQNAGGCLKSKQIRIKEKIINGVKVFEVSFPGETEEVYEDDDVELAKVEGKKSTLVVYPNPATDQIQLSEYGQNVSIYDLNGRLIQSYTYDTANSNPQAMDVSQLPNGLYIIQSDQQKVKLVIQR